MFTPKKMNRRTLMKVLSGAFATMGVVGKSKASENNFNSDRFSMVDFKAPPIKKVRIIVVGIGKRGKTAVARLVKIPGVEIVAVVDLRESEVLWADKIIRRYLPKQKAPKMFFGDPEEYLKSYNIDFDLAYICTPWKWHVPMAISAMKVGAHAAVEVPIATTIKGCWDLVYTSEQTRRHCVMLENVCYGETEMAVRNMCKAGLFGEIVYGEASYIHDLRESLIDDKRFPKHWRLAHSVNRNGNLYPTHGLGPVAQYMDINVSDRLVSLVSMSSSSRGIQSFFDKNYEMKNASNNLGVVQGDMNSSLIRTKLGRTILVQFSTGSPRPYTRNNLIQGTKGIFAGFPDRIALDPNPHEWSSKDMDYYFSKYGDERWERMDEEDRANGGHGGMDTVMDRSIINSLQKGLPMDISVYDSVLWSVISPLSELSVAQGSKPVDIPDFIPQ